MNTWQAAKQLQYMLQTTYWPASSNPVFASVHVTQQPGEAVTDDLRFPLALVRVLDASGDPASPGLKDQRWEIIVVCSNTGDQLGEFAMVGGQRASATLSKGRGLLEIEEQLRNTVNLGDGTIGFEVVEVNASSAEAALVENRGYCVWRSYTLFSVLSTSRTYGVPNGTNALTSAAGTPSGGNTPMTISWAAATSRFDHHAAISVPALAARGGFVLVRKAGTSAPATITDGTALGLSSSFATSFSENLSTGSGNWTYGLFAKFDEFGDGATSIQYSVPASVTVNV